MFVVFILLLFFPLSIASVMTCDLQVNQSQLWYSTRREVCNRGSKEENLIRYFPLHSWKKKRPSLSIFYITVAYNLYAFLVCGYCCAMLPVLNVLQDVTVIHRRRKYPGRTYFGWMCQRWVCRRGFWFSTMLWGVEALPSGEGERLKSPVHMESRICCFLLLLPPLLFYCEGWGAVLSGLLSWVAGGLLLQGALLPRAGELLKSSSSSKPLVASYCVFSRRVIRRSSSSPNSPPIRVGSPTTITSWRERQRHGEQTYKCSCLWVHTF